jgi:AbrB family looped-hinge helix DNA binding protein
MAEAARVGKRGTVVIPARLRKRFGLEEGTSVLVDEGPEGIVIRPAVTVPVEIYTLERKAEFLLQNAVDAKDYDRARREVRRMGLDPDAVPHRRPRKR